MGQIILKRTFGTCINPECRKKEVLLIKKTGLCLNCHSYKKKIEYLTKKKMKEGFKGFAGKRKATGELKIFVEIWNEREHVSEINGEEIPHFDIRCFSHILPKSLYPSFRLDKRNIVLKTPDQHLRWGEHKWTLKGLKEWEWVFMLERKLKREYNEKFNQNKF
jgi:hypothetical protein